MHDIKIIRDDPEAFDAGLAKRGIEPQAARLIAIDERRRKIIASLQEMQAARNDASKQIGAAKAKKDEALAQKLMDEVAHLKAKIQAGEEDERAVTAELETELAAIPNIPYETVPVGPDETANVEYRRHGSPRAMNFTPREHFDLGEALGLMDFETAAKLSGARFVVLKGLLARLERAIANFMLDLHTREFGYTEVNPPLLVKDQTMFGTAQLPKFADDQFAVYKGQSVSEQDKYWLIPTAEVSLTNLVRESILSEEELPLRLTAWTPCFRAEAGSAGRDTRGMIRMHQFSKVELVSVTTPEQADEEHERMLACAEGVLKALDLHYRVVTLSTGDMGFSSRKTYDIEVWLPGQGAFREISSCSVCGDFQARRMQARYKPAGSKTTRFVNTLNGSGLAVGRTLIAILENYQQADGSIAVPAALKPYMGGQEVIAANG
ncbi:MAG TPA: serine--tRNA ligase [Parvibaculum sp.]|uniref:serine--tRNA ligase n=1 Tax=Parvibaculum sp. TaxID=2024848 RepID=UPI002B9ED799|nr:serine--tRNA ligase [Parvibaculum sp.]HMM13566.1 serine--tRNA ligase [Parvibaculum sp.]